MTEHTFPAKTVKNLDELDERKILVRVDFNVPLDDNGNVDDTTRLKSALPTLEYLLERNARLILMSHLGRPGGEVDDSLRLDSIVGPLQELLSRPVTKSPESIGEQAESMVEDLDGGEVALLENLRFHSGEKSADTSYAKALARMGDVYVNDAFGTSHRSHTSITGVPRFLKPAVGGKLLIKEFENLIAVRESPSRPFLAILGGAKISDKLPIIRYFLEHSEYVLIGGAMAHTFDLARGGSIGDSLVEPDFVDDARTILDNSDSYRGELILPDDVVIGPSEDPTSDTRTVPAGNIPDGYQGLDIGSKAVKSFEEVIGTASGVFWNGPMGVFENEAFATGTRQIVQALATSNAEVVVGGGDSASAVKKFGESSDFTHVSTGGGASLQLIQDGSLPGVEILDRK